MSQNPPSVMLKWTKPLPERIVFCIDLSAEVNATNFTKSKSKGLTRLGLIKTAVSLFVEAKARLSDQHQFSICALTEIAIWYQEFTADIDLFKGKLMKLEPQEASTRFDMISVFGALSDQCGELFGPKPPSFVYRLIFLYSRSTVLPQPLTYAKNDLVAKFCDNPNFFFDMLYLHYKPSKDNRSQEIFDVLTEVESDLEDHAPLYLFENSSNKHKVFTNFAMLLAHPHQRPEQGAFNIVPFGDKKK